MKKPIKRYEHKCLRCNPPLGWKWFSSSKEPITCPHCGSPYWRNPIEKEG
jgi:DNA-directed RNA polymerase subunit RPC12/RpoP